MLTFEELERQNRYLRAEIDELRERVRQLTSDSVEPLPPNVPHLTRREEELLRLLMKREGRTVLVESIYQSIYRDTDGVGSNTLAVFISKLRRKLKGTGMVISTDYGRGWALSREAGQ